MDKQWLNDAVANMRQIGNDTQLFEVKESKGKLPSSMGETMSAFSNGAGGFILLGLSEKQGFTCVEGFDARSIQDALASACEQLFPAVRPEIETIPFEDGLVVCARIDEMHPRDKPCYVIGQGIYRGSYIRTADGDRRLTHYEIDRMLEQHRQPTHDDAPVLGARAEDLDSVLVQGFVRRQKELHPRILGNRDDRDVLLDLHVFKEVDGGAVPTLAGIIAMGTFPQKFFPRLNLTFTAYPGIDKTAPANGGRRFLDSRTIVGSIPYMVQEAVDAVERNMRIGAVIDGAFRRDVPDYPRVAVREAVANALMHRDYSPEAQGSQVQVNLFADRLEILNPGGLYGDVTVDTLGVSGISSSRNQFLSNILETTPYPEGGYVVENRGTGYQEIEEQLNRAMMRPPIPVSTTATFRLTFEKRRMALRERMIAPAEEVATSILEQLSSQSSASSLELARGAGVSRATVNKHIRRLVDEGVIEPIEPLRSPKQRYRLAR